MKQVFGYGSLVNLDTHNLPYVGLHSHNGFRRAWVQLPDRAVSILTVRRDPLSQIDGLVCAVNDADWEALDEREAAYDRGEIDTDHGPAALYEVPMASTSPGDASKPIVLSYLDAVLQGYLRAFGDGGAVRFMRSTTGWTVPVLNDRAAPKYPRAVQLSDDDRRIIDHLLEVQAVQIVQEN